MKEFYALDLKAGTDITEFFMLKSKAVKIGSNGKKYADLILGDNSGELISKKWDLSDVEEELLMSIPEGEIIKVKANVTEWLNQTQLKINKFRAATEADGISMMDYVRCAPEDPNEMYDYILGKAEGLGDEDLRKLAVKLLKENKEKLLYYPAASKNHHAEMAGLLYHVKRMLMTGERACEVYTNLNKDLVLCGVIIHDIEKLNEIESNSYGVSPGYSFEGQLIGHLVQGVKKIDEEAIALNIPREKAIMLEHMMLSHHYEPEFGSPKKPMFPEAELLHYLDILDARMYDFEFAMEGLGEGEFTEKVWTLDGRKVYKPTF